MCLVALNARASSFHLSTTYGRYQNLQHSRTGFCEVLITVKQQTLLRTANVSNFQCKSTTYWHWTFTLNTRARCFQRREQTPARVNTQEVYIYDTLATNYYDSFAQKKVLSFFMEPNIRRMLKRVDARYARLCIAQWTPYKNSHILTAFLRDRGWVVVFGQGKITDSRQYSNSVFVERSYDHWVVSCYAKQSLNKNCLISWQTTTVHKPHLTNRNSKHFFWLSSTSRYSVIAFLHIDDLPALQLKPSQHSRTC